MAVPASRCESKIQGLIFQDKLELKIIDRNTNTTRDTFIAETTQSLRYVLELSEVSPDNHKRFILRRQTFSACLKSVAHSEVAEINEPLLILRFNNVVLIDDVDFSAAKPDLIESTYYRPSSMLLEKLQLP